MRSRSPVPHEAPDRRKPVPSTSRSPRAGGFDTTHVADIGLAAATDSEIFDRAVTEGFVIVTADSDFAMLLALRRSTSPSVIQLRHVAELGPDAHVELVLSNLPAIITELDEPRPAPCERVLERRWVS